MWLPLLDLLLVSMLSVVATAALFLIAVRAVRAEDNARWIGSPTLNGSPGSGRRSGKLRQAA